MTTTLTIEGMSCMHCAGRVKSALEQISGVTKASVSLESGSAIVEVEKEVLQDQFASAIAETGYQLLGVQ